MIPFIVIFVMHFLADFVFQSSKMATGKSKSFKWLSIHVGVYALVSLLSFAFLVYCYGDPLFVFYWWALNVGLHFITDLFTSKITSKFWEEKNMRFFFVMIGFDQLIHQVCLISTFIFVKEIIIIRSF